MGVATNVGFKEFPQQGRFLSKEVLVFFNYDTHHKLKGTVVRNDAEEPFETIFKLEDGRYILSTECQYSVV